MFSVVSVCSKGVIVQGPRMFKLVHYEARTVGEPALGIRLKCLLADYFYNCMVQLERITLTI